MKKPGRASLYSKALADRICKRLAAGESLRSICRDDKMPSESTVRRWALEDMRGFSAQYAQARDLGLDTIADEILDIADDGLNDTYKDEDGNKRTDHDVIARSRLRVDARKWYLSKMAPKRYGDKISAELTGADGGPIEFTDTERAAKIAAILAAAHARKADGADDPV